MPLVLILFPASFLTPINIGLLPIQIVGSLLPITVRLLLPGLTRSLVLIVFQLLLLSFVNPFHLASPLYFFLAPLPRTF